MPRWLFLVLMILMCELSSASDGEKDEASTNRFIKEMIVRAHQKLTTGLYKAFARKNGNLLLSPWSVMSLLTVTYMVAGGRTANEIGDQLNINLLRRKEILAGFEHINEVFKHSENSSRSEVVDSVNGAYIAKKVHPHHRLKKLLRESLNTYIHHIIANDHDDNDKRSNENDGEKLRRNVTSVERKRERLRGFLSEKTHGQLDSLLPKAEDVAGRTSLWLFNVMYFQGTWRSPFSQANTHTADFWVDGTTPVPVVTMTTRASFPRSHYPQLEMTLLELPYGQVGRYGLFILLPDKADGLSKLEKKLRQFNLESMLAESHWSRQAKVFLPTFKFQTDLTLKEVMKKLGFKRMFSPKDADFTRLDPKKRNGDKSPYVQTMLHRAVIEVSENGTTASAATAMKVSFRRYVHYFRVNHPFMFVLRDKTLNINLFVGRVTDPRQLS